MERPISLQSEVHAEPSRTSGWQQTAERIVVGLGYELVDCERSSQGLLRVYIDRVPGCTYDTGESEFVTVDDCEKVTRQLQYTLEVDGYNYSRLEVSSPGLDRPLKKPADFARFLGCEVDVTLKQLFQGKKKWRGVLDIHEEDASAVAGAATQGWRLIFTSADGQKQALGFTLDEVREARLVPVVNFKGRARGAAAPSEVQGQQSGGLEE